MSEEKLNIYQKLQKVQYEMKAPKNLYNSFGKYNYRNAESILESFKPFGERYGLTLVLNDEIIVIGERYYVKAIATIIDVENGETFSVSALARESVTKKGMDDSQVTGATSSYARKYCLNGLFLLDDTKDADTDEYHNQTNINKQQQTSTNINKQQQTTTNITDNKQQLNGIHPQKSTKEQLLQRLNELMQQSAIEESYIAKKFEVEKIEELTKEKIYSTILMWDKVVKAHESEKVVDISEV